MFKRQKNIDRKVDELFDQLYEVEGEIIDCLTYYDISGYIHSINFSSSSIKEFNRIHSLTEEDKGSAMINALTPEVCQEILPMPDGYIENVLIELKGVDGNKYYLIDVRDSIPYGKGDLVKVIIDRDQGKKYQSVYTIIHVRKNILWTPVLIERGRIASLKKGSTITIKLIGILIIFNALGALFSLFICLFSGNCEDILETFIEMSLYWSATVLILAAFFISLWWFFPNEEDYIGHIRAEAVFKKLGFNAVKFLDLEDYSSYKINKKNKIQVLDINRKNEEQSYLLEIALKEHNKKYKN